MSLGLAQVTVSGVLLGLIGQLQVLALLAVNLSVCLALAWLTLVRTSDGRMAVTRLVTRVGSCIAVVNSRFGLRFLVLLLLAELGVVCMTNLLVPNLDSDGLVYHLPMVNVMIQNQHIYDVPYHLSEITAYPKTVEMYFLWNTLLPGSHALVDFSQIPFYILLLLSTVELLRGMGRSRDAAIFGGVLTLFFPVVMRQLGTNYIDVAVSALIVSIVSVLHPMLRLARLLDAQHHKLPMYYTNIHQSHQYAL